VRCQLSALSRLLDWRWLGYKAPANESSLSVRIARDLRSNMTIAASCVSVSGIIADDQDLASLG